MGYWGVVPNFNAYDYTGNPWYKAYETTKAVGVHYIPITPSSGYRLVHHAQFYIEAVNNSHLCTIELIKNWDEASSYELLWGRVGASFLDYDTYGSTNSDQFKILYTNNGKCGVDLDFPAPLKLKQTEILMWRFDNNSDGDAYCYHTIVKSNHKY